MLSSQPAGSNRKAPTQAQQQQGCRAFRLYPRHCLPTLGEEANGEGDDDGRAIASYFTARQTEIQRRVGSKSEGE